MIIATPQIGTIRMHSCMRVLGLYEVTVWALKVEHQQPKVAKFTNRGSPVFPLDHVVAFL